jgi:hypothetical protein
MRFKAQRRDLRKMLLHGLGARLGDFNRPGIRKEKKFVRALFLVITRESG